MRIRLARSKWEENTGLCARDGPMSNFEATMHDIPFAGLDFDA
jgi:hypothetical protein